jgi:general secretion pathway protein C
MDTLLRFSQLSYMAATLACAWLAARIVNTLIAGSLCAAPAFRLEPSVPAAPIAHAQLDAELLSKLFDVPIPRAGEDGPDGPTNVVAVSVWGEAQRSPLRATLVGTAIATPVRYSLVELVDLDRNETAVYTLGDVFMGARIHAIERDRVLIDHRGHNEFIDGAPAGQASPQPLAARGAEGVRQVTESQYVISRKIIDGALSDLSHLATQARIVPAPNGFRIFAILPDSLYARIGVENGDVIRRINGYDINSPDKALEIYQKLRDASRIQLEIERRGVSLRKSYSIESS